MARSNFLPRRFYLFVYVVFGVLLSSAQASVPAATYVAQGNSPDPQNNLTIAINVPQNNTDNLFFHFSAPAGQSWAAFGFGDQMKGALMFVAYASQDGKNVTVSPRLGTGHSMPQSTSNVKMHLLDGTGISNDIFVVNGFCSGCRSWSGGSVNVDSTSQSMIWAVGPSSVTLQSNDLSAAIQQHEVYDRFSVNLLQATGLGGVPVVLNGETAVSNESGRNFHAGVAFHALLMVGAFLVVFPAGYLFLRVFERLWLHWGIQSFAAVLVVVGTIVGIVISVKDDFIIGLLVMVLVLSTWTIGFVGHRIFKKTGAPAKAMKAHKILGPLTISLGLTNACLGFNFAGNNRAIIGFIIVTILMFVFVSSIIFMKNRRQVRKQALNSAAAQNFRQGQMEPQYAGPAPGYGQNIPLQSYHQGYPDQAPPVYR